MKRFVIGSAIGVITVLMSASGALAHTEFQPSGANAGKTDDFKLFVDNHPFEVYDSQHKDLFWFEKIYTVNLMKLMSNFHVKVE